MSSFETGVKAECYFIRRNQKDKALEPNHSTVTDFAKLRGLSTSVPRTSAT